MSDPTRMQDRALRERAVAFLISSAWLTREAANQRVVPSKREVEAWIAKKRASFPGGSAEYSQFLESTHESTADVNLEAVTQLAAVNLRKLVQSRTKTVTQAEIANYYDRHKEQFAIPERREVLSINRKTLAATRALKREIEAGKNFATVAQRWTVQAGPVGPHDGTQEARERLAFENAMFSSPRNVLIGPIKRRVDYYLLEVKQITPGRQHTLHEADSSIRKLLTA